MSLVAGGAGMRFWATETSLGRVTGGGLGGRAFVVWGGGGVEDGDGEGWVGLWLR